MAGSLFVRGGVMRATLAVLAVSLLSTEVRAGGPPLDVPLLTPNPDLQGQVPTDTTFSIVGPDDYQDLKFTAAAGMDYWVGIGTDWTGHMQAFDPAGNLFASGEFFGAGDADEEQGGFELHAQAAGAYTVRVWLDGDYPASGYAWFWPDCRGGPATRCTIAPGKAQVGSWGDTWEDDSFVIKAPPGRYAATLTITSGQYLARLQLLNGRGQVLLQKQTGLAGTNRFTRTVPF